VTRLRQFLRAGSPPHPLRAPSVTAAPAASTHLLLAGRILDFRTRSAAVAHFHTERGPEGDVPAAPSSPAREPICPALGSNEYQQPGDPSLDFSNADCFGSPSGTFVG
jgi:hypothetical protein